ncbi:hypothetical protein [Usitatibacter palustris]|nr:hypothetical protein [Usitatibacter palustris]
MRAKSNGKMGFTTKPEMLGAELAFWEIEDDDELDEFLSGDLLAAIYGTDMPPLPKGYEPLLYVLEFERHCQFEGWTAIGNRSSDMGRIIESYRVLGLADEASALEAVVAAAEKISDNDDEYHDVLGKAYGSVANKTPDIEDRLPLIYAFVRGHPDWFGEEVR